MSNSWQQLVKQLGLTVESPPKKHAIICAPNVDSLKQFEARYLPSGCNFVNTTMDVLGFCSAVIEVGDHSEKSVRNVELDAYAIPFPITSVALKYLSPFVNLKDDKRCSPSWYFLLDWSMSDQKFWLRQLISSIELLDNAGASMPTGSVTVCCVNTDHIYTWQKNTTQWLPQHVEFVQQTLRSFCLLKKCSLLFCTTISPSSTTTDFDRDTFFKLLTGRFNQVDADLVSASELRVPWGSDTVGLIKTVSENFDPSQVLTDDFVNAKYENFIPNLVKPASQSDEAPAKRESIDPFKVDVQYELSKIYQQVQNHKKANP